MSDNKGSSQRPSSTPSPSAPGINRGYPPTQKTPPQMPSVNPPKQKQA